MDKNTFYDDNSDTAFTCKDGDIRINKLALSEPQMVKFTFFNNVFEANEFSVTDFTQFLDVLMGFEEIQYNTALQVFPIVKKFEFEALLKSCIEILKPKKMCKDVISTLNLSMRYNCEELMVAVINYLILYDIHLLLLEEEYYLLLEPKPLLSLLKTIPKNELILKSIVNWGLEYIKKNNIQDDLRGFLRKNGILGKFSIYCLSSMDSIVDLYDPEGRENIFEEKEMMNRLKNIYVSKGRKNSTTLEKLDKTIMEHFFLRYPLLVQESLNFVIEFNPFFKKHGASGKCFTCKVLLLTEENVLAARITTELHIFDILSSENGSIRCPRGFSVPAYLRNHLLYAISIEYAINDCKIFKAKPDLSEIFSDRPAPAFTKSLYMC